MCTLILTKIFNTLLTIVKRKITEFETRRFDGSSGIDPERKKRTAKHGLAMFTKNHTITVITIIACRLQCSVFSDYSNGFRIN